MKFLRSLLALTLILGAPGLALAGDSASVSVTPGLTATNRNTLASGVTESLSFKLPNGYTSVDFANGTSAGQVDVLWTKVLTIAASSSTTLDLTALSGGSGTGGGAAALAKVKCFGFYSLDVANTGPTFTVAGGASNPWVGPLAGTAPTYTVPAGGAWVYHDQSTAGLAISGTAKSIKFTNNSATASCNIAVVFAGN